VNAEQIKPNKAGNSVERLSGDRERREGRPHKMEIRNTSEDAWKTFCNFQHWLGYTGLFIGNFSGSFGEAYTIQRENLRALACYLLS